MDGAFGLRWSRCSRGWFVSSLIITWALVLIGCGVDQTPTPTFMPTQEPTATPGRFWEEAEAMWDHIEPSQLSIERHPALLIARSSVAPIETHMFNSAIQHGSELFLEFRTGPNLFVSQKYVWNGERWRYVSEYCEAGCS